MLYMKKEKIFVVLAALLFCAVSAAQVKESIPTSKHEAAQQGLQGKHPEKGIRHGDPYLAGLKEELNLTDDQAKSIQQILDIRQKEAKAAASIMEKARREMTEKMEKSRTETDEKIKATLNDVQRKKFEEMNRVRPHKPMPHSLRGKIRHRSGCEGKPGMPSPPDYDMEHGGPPEGFPGPEPPLPGDE